MSFTRTKYDPCEKSASCNIPKGIGEYMMDINRFENTTTCNVNNNSNINYYNSDIQNRIDIENELLVLNHQLGNCTTNKPTLCMTDPTQNICTQSYAIKNICDPNRSQCDNNPNSINCFGLNAGLSCNTNNSGLFR
jgi:hypothetical protein